jgi:glyoxylase-like metal-dependent hydrolase (beta-lactamase superfamily II)
MQPGSRPNDDLGIVTRVLTRKPRGPGPSVAMRPTEVAEGIYRLGTKWANFYLVVEDGEALLVDAGYPGYWKQLTAALETLGLPAGAVRAVIVTHHHVDHAGTAERLRNEGGATVLVHEADAAKVSGELRSHVPPGFYRHSWRPSMARYLAHTVRVGGARYRPVRALESITTEQVMDLAAQPRILPTPGHTAGHCSVALESRGVLLTGDAMLNFDYASGEVGLNLHRFNDDRDAAYDSLTSLDRFDLPVVLFGHGDPWANGSRRALEVVRTRAAGAVAAI